MVLFLIFLIFMKRIFYVDVYLAQENEYTLDMMLLSIRKENHYNARKCPWNCSV